MQTQIRTEENPAQHAEKLYDLCMIQSLCRGNKAQVKELIQNFIDETPMAVAELKSAYRNNDFLLIKKVAHRIKPVLNYYAVVKIEKEVEKLELQAGEQLVAADLESAIHKVDLVVNEIVSQMQQRILYQY